MLLFLLENAPLEPWERDVLEIVRDEAYYFAPQAQTKIMNEGWAAYWHSKIMTREGAARRPRSSTTPTTTRACWRRRRGSSTRTRSASSSSATSRSAGTRGGSARSGTSARTWRRASAGTGASGLGRKKIFEVRKLYNDVTFIDEFFTEEFCRENKFFSFGFNERTGNYEIESREFKKVKDKLLFRLTNFGEPFIFVEDGNFENRGELLLRHKHEGVDLEDGPRARHARGAGARVAAAGQPAHARRRQGQDAALRRARPLREGRRLPR